MDKVTTAALAQKSAAKKTSKMKKLFNKLYATATALTAMASLTGLQAFADDEWGEVSVASSNETTATSMMGKILGILLTLCRYVGIALVIYGVYEVVMSFMQNQPEAKTKGIVMALAGVVMIALKSILEGIGVIGNGAAAA